MHRPLNQYFEELGLARLVLNPRSTRVEFIPTRFQAVINGVVTTISSDRITLIPSGEALCLENFKNESPRLRLVLETL